MRKLWITLLVCTLLLFFIPLLLIKESPKLVGGNKAKEAKDEIAHCPFEITVNGMDKPLELEEYVKGVVAAEMPSSFHEEALKAQAIAARTYALKTTEKGKIPIATDVSAQVFYTQAERKKNWGKEFAKNEKKVSAAVDATAGEMIIYGDELISAMFFSTSNGQTETAQNFSGNDIPYLQSVDSSGEADVAPVYEEKTEITLDEWNKALEGKWSADMFESLQLVRNSTGRVQKVMTDGFEREGRDMREILGLRSTDFDIAFDMTNNLVLVTTVGYGHGVGMSQYGAEAFAGEGWTAEKIIEHYYTGTTIKKFLINDPECLKTP